jgi:hypothetical protein
MVPLVSLNLVFDWQDVVVLSSLPECMSGVCIERLRMEEVGEQMRETERDRMLNYKRNREEGEKVRERENDKLCNKGKVLLKNERERL